MTPSFCAFVVLSCLNGTVLPFDDEGIALVNCDALPVYAAGVVCDMMLTYVRMFWLGLVTIVADVPLFVCMFLNNSPCVRVSPIARMAARFFAADAERMTYDYVALYAVRGMVVAAVSVIGAVVISVVIIRNIRYLTKK